MYKIGFSTIGCPEANVDEIIELATANGFQGVEFRFVRGEVDLRKLEEFQPAQIGETRKKFDDAGIKVVGLGSSVRFTSLDPAERELQIEDFRANIAIAKALDVPYIRVFGGPFPEGQDREKTWDAIVSGLTQVADEAHAEGVTAMIEMHDDFSTSESIDELWSRGVSKHLGILWDTLHTYRHGESAEKTWAAVGDRVKHVHLKDSAKSNSEGFDLVLTGEGNVPIKSFLDVLKAADYDGFVDFEWERAWHPELVSAEVAFPHFMKYLASVS